MRLQFISREDFIRDYFDWRPGEHINVIGTTGTGKTHLFGQIADRVLTEYPELTYASLVPKPRDSAAVDWKSNLGLRETDSWPPKRHFWEDPPRGHLLWPKHVKNDEDANRAHLSRVFKNCFNDLYWRGDSITNADDAYLLGVTYGLNTELDRHWIAGRSSGAALWTALQKPSGTVSGAVSSFAYDSPTHLFFGRDNDARNLKRISEIAISQLDPFEIQETIRNLRVHRISDSAVSDLLYVDRRGPYLCIVGVY